MSDGILIVDMKANIKYANDTFCKLFGYTIDELMGKSSIDLFVKESDASKVRIGLEERKNSRSSQYELEVRSKNGDKLNVLVSGSPYMDQNGNITGSIAIITNITSIKETQKTLAYNEARLKQAQEVAHVGSWELNFATGNAIWSDEACRMYGLALEERQNQNFESWIKFIHPDDLDMVKREIEKSQKTLSDSSYKHRIVLNDGSIRHIHSVSKFEFNEAGFPLGLVGVCYDITDQVEAELKLRESEENFRTFINESQLGIYFVDPETKKILYSNPALSELLGYSSNELREILPYDFINHSERNINERIEDVM